jgi:hypothetical protein
MSNIPKLLIVNHSARFFSNCTVLLEAILSFYNTYGRTPEELDTTGLFLWYSPEDSASGADVRKHYFLPEPAPAIIRGPVEKPATVIRAGSLNYVQQFSDYRDVDFFAVAPFVTNYFSVVPEIIARANAIQAKYAIDPANTCVIFHRGNDKGMEVRLPDYDDYAVRARAVMEKFPDTTVLLQSDESEFFSALGEAFPGAVSFQAEIRHIPRCMSTVDVECVRTASNHEMSKNFLAIMIIMSRCRFVVCGSGNCAMWIALFRGNAKGVYQILARMLDVVPEWITESFRNSCNVVS